MDGATLAVTQLQSTSDQQDPLRFAPIAAAAPTVVPPEQGAVWAYPQPGFDDDLITFTLGGALLGRIHLSGHLHRMPERQLGLVRNAVAVYKTLRADLARAVPFWPLGLPGWTDDWLALGMRVTGEGASYVSVWQRGGDGELRLPVNHLAGREVRTEVLYPSAPVAGSVRWDGGRTAGVAAARARCSVDPPHVRGVEGPPGRGSRRGGGVGAHGRRTGLSCHARRPPRPRPRRRTARGTGAGLSTVPAARRAGPWP